MNTAHVLTSFYLMFNTDLSLEEFQNKFDLETIIGSKIEFTLPDGSVHTATFASLEEMKIDEFEESEDKEKVTKQSA